MVSLRRMWNDIESTIEIKMNRAKNSTEVLKAAKWILENVGWIKGEFTKRDKKGNYLGFCAAGALSAVRKSDPDDWMKARERLAKQMGCPIASFNDDKKTTKKMVIDAFDRAIRGSK
jgi:hypothetical protein